MNASDRTKSINLELLEEMFQVEEKEKALNPGNFFLILIAAKFKIRINSKLHCESGSKEVKSNTIKICTTEKLSFYGHALGFHPQT